MQEDTALLAMYMAQTGLTAAADLLLSGIKCKQRPFPACGHAAPGLLPSQQHSYCLLQTRATYRSCPRSNVTWQCHLDHIMSFCHGVSGAIAHIVPGSQLGIVEQQVLPHGVAHTGWHLLVSKSSEVNYGVR